MQNTKILGVLMALVMLAGTGAIAADSAVPNSSTSHQKVYKSSWMHVNNDHNAMWKSSWKHHDKDPKWMWKHSWKLNKHQDKMWKYSWILNKHSKAMSRNHCMHGNNSTWANNSTWNNSKCNGNNSTWRIILNAMEIILHG